MSSINYLIHKTDFIQLYKLSPNLFWWSQQSIKKLKFPPQKIIKSKNSRVSPVLNPGQGWILDTIILLKREQIFYLNRHYEKLSHEILKQRMGVEIALKLLEIFEKIQNFIDFTNMIECYTTKNSQTVDWNLYILKKRQEKPIDDSRLLTIKIFESCELCAIWYYDTFKNWISTVCFCRLIDA